MMTVPPSSPSTRASWARSLPRQLANASDRRETAITLTRTRMRTAPKWMRVARTGDYVSGEESGQAPRSATPGPRFVLVTFGQRFNAVLQRRFRSEGFDTSTRQAGQRIDDAAGQLFGIRR